MTSTCVFVSRAHSDFLKRDVAVFLLRIGVALVFQGAESGDDAGATVGRLDDSVNVTAFGGDKGIGEAVAKFGDPFLANLSATRFGNLRRCTLVSSIHRA